MVDLIPRNVLFGNPERISPHISPDGTRLAWIAPDNGVLNVWVAPIGASGVDADAEALFMAIEAFDAVGLSDARFDINHASVVDGVLDGLGLDAAQAQAAKRLIADRNVVDLRAFVVKHAPGSRDLDVLIDLALLRGAETVLDLARLRFMDLTGLRSVLRLHVHCLTADTALTIKPGPRAVQRIFELTRSDHLLTFVAR